MKTQLKNFGTVGVCFFLMSGFANAQTSKKNDSLNEKKIEEVVLVGYGTQKKTTASGAVANLNVAVVKDRPVTSLLTAMQGALPGVTILQRPGDVGNDRGTPNIRGRGNLGGSAPLFVVDGVIVSQTDFAMINPNDVENLTVLKDAAAAIYGSRAAYGVILVTTKKGTGGKMSVNYDAMMGYQMATYLPKKLGSVDYMTLRNEAAVNAGKKAYYTSEEIEKAKSGQYPDLYPNTDWYKLVYKEAAPIMEHTVSMNGGGKTRYYLSLGYLNQESLQPDKGLNRYTVRANTSSVVSDIFNINSNFSFVKEDIKSGSATDITTPLARMVPTMVPIQSNGNWGSVNAGKADVTLGKDNPLRSLSESGKTRNESTTFLGSITGTLKPFKGAVLEGQLSYKDRTQIATEFKNEIGPLMNFLTGKPFTGSEITPNSYKETWNKTSSFAAQLYGSYDTRFGNHDFKLLAGVSYEDNRLREIMAQRKNVLSNGMEAIDAGANTDGNVLNSGLPQSDAFQSFFSRFNYSYKDKYFIEALFRADATSRFSSNNRWGYYPSILASWRIDKEKFMENVKFVNDLKLRASVGKTGNVYNVGYWDYLSLLSTGVSGVLDEAKINGVWPAKIPNPNLRWETVISKNIGLDGTLFNRSFTFQLDIFDRLTKDILYRVPVPAELGVADPAKEWPSENLSRVRNRGVELSVGYQKNKKDLQYYINANVSRTWNKIIKLDDPIIDGKYISRQNDAVGAFYGYEAMGLYTADDVKNNYPKISTNTQPGDIKYKDQNGDGKIDAADRVVLGNDVPYITFGLSGGITYKNFDFSFIAQGVADVKVYLGNEASQAFFNGGSPKEYVLGRWTPENPNPNAVYPRLLESANNNQNYNDSTTSSFWLFNADYIRIKTLTLGYSLPNSVLSNLGIQKFRIYVTANNFFTIRGDKRMKDFDPEMASSRASYPQTKVIALGLNVKF